MWDKEIEIARSAATEAGRVLNALFGKVAHIKEKGPMDIFTEADTEAERVILETIHHHFPDDGILAEETGEHARRRERMWLVDPLDGTVNFAHAVPLFSVSIALQVEGDGVLGVVLNPHANECFEAVQGKGAYLNKKNIRVSRARDLRESLLAVGFSHSIHENPRRVMDHLTKMSVRAQGVRRLGSAAIDLCYVAAGRLDGYWEEGLNPWDSAAGAIIVREAGGVVTHYDGKPYSPFVDTIVASNPFIHDQMLAVVST